MTALAFLNWLQIERKNEGEARKSVAPPGTITTVDQMWKDPTSTEWPNWARCCSTNFQCDAVDAVVLS